MLCALRRLKCCVPRVVLITYIRVMTYCRIDSASIERLLNSNHSTKKKRFVTSMIKSVQSFHSTKLTPWKIKQTDAESRITDALALSAQIPSVEYRIRTGEDWMRRNILRISRLYKIPNENFE